MDKTKLIQRLMTTFLEELEEHVRAFNRDLLVLEKSPPAPERAECLKTLFRTAHSLKGAARSVNVTLIEAACHRLESILERIRSGGLEMRPELFRLLFASVDAIEEAGMRLREQHDLTDAPLAALIPRLDAGVLGDLAAPGETPAPQQDAEAAETPAREQLESGNVRVSAEKLDSLLGRIGELLVARRRIESQVSEVAALEELIDHWDSEWRSIAKVIEGLCGDGRAVAAGKLEIPRRAKLVLRHNGTRLRKLKKDVERLTAAMKSDSRMLKQVIVPLDDEVHTVRMLPFAEACAGLERTVRDLAQAGGKDVALIVEGGSVELDRSILDALKDPLRQLVRNAVDHGIEAPAGRVQAGKPRRGRIVVRAALRGSQVEVVVQDDGGGLNLDALREQARRRLSGTDPSAMANDELMNLMFLPGVSTASIITDVSGRGVGLDIVKSQVESLHGTVAVSFVAGQGTTFTLTAPLTLTTLRAVLVKAADQVFALAGTSVHKLALAGPDDVRTVAGRDMLMLGGQLLPFAPLAGVLQVKTNGEAKRTETRSPVLVVAAGEKLVAFAVDEFLSEQEILVKSLGSRIRQVPHVAGATLLPSGKVALLLNGPNLVRTALSRSPVARPAKPAGEPIAVKKRLLVVEDSVTTRTLEKSILEGAGYEVATAIDGQAAWDFLQNHAIDLIVSDVEMPNMDGFELAQAVRASPNLQSMPLILVTARETDQDKARGIDVGADAYLVKSAFDQRQLLETIAQLL